MIPQAAVDLLNDVSRWCLVAAISALGMKMSFKQVPAAGWRVVGLMIAEKTWDRGVSFHVTRLPKLVEQFGIG
jgi:uncharacterized membrane protein YadS